MGDSRVERFLIMIIDQRKAAIHELEQEIAAFERMLTKVTGRGVAATSPKAARRKSGDRRRQSGPDQ